MDKHQQPVTPPEKHVPVKQPEIAPPQEPDYPDFPAEEPETYPDEEPVSPPMPEVPSPS